jgi:hypothetical protein
MKHFLKIGSLVVVLVCILVSNSFAGDKNLFSPTLSGNVVQCCIRNVSSKKQIHVSITIFKDDTNINFAEATLDPGQSLCDFDGIGSGRYHCNFTASKKNVVASICKDSGECLNVHEKYR